MPTAVEKYKKAFMKMLTERKVHCQRLALLKYSSNFVSESKMPDVAVASDGQWHLPMSRKDNNLKC